MEKIKTLIADDSVVYRSQIRAALAEIPQIEVVAAVSNGRLALQRMQQSPVDLLILDLEMPEVDGLQVLAEMRARQIHCKVLVFSSTSKRGSEITLEALRSGATDFIPKPGADATSFQSSALPPDQRIRALLEPHIHSLFGTSGSKSARTDQIAAHPKPASGNFPRAIWDLLVPQVVVIGSSTGGPSALEKIFSQIPGPLLCPVVIAQHMPPIFTAALAERLGKISGIPCFEARQGMPVENAIYVAPGDYHLRITGSREQASLTLDQGPQINFVRPAVDPLFASAANLFKDRCLGVVLTGMGSDGRDGSVKLKEAGATVLIQNEKSCVVFGMPGAVMGAGAFDQALDLDAIASCLREKICLTSAAGKVPHVI